PIDRGRGADDGVSQSDQQRAKFFQTCDIYRARGSAITGCEKFSIDPIGRLRFGHLTGKRLSVGIEPSDRSGFHKVAFVLAVDLDRALLPQRLAQPIDLSQCCGCYVAGRSHLSTPCPFCGLLFRAFSTGATCLLTGGDGGAAIASVSTEGYRDEVFTYIAQRVTTFCRPIEQPLLMSIDQRLS